MASMHEAGFFCITESYLSRSQRPIYCGVAIACSGVGSLGAIIRMYRWRPLLVDSTARRKPSPNPWIAFMLAISDLLACIGTLLRAVMMLCTSYPSSDKSTGIYRPLIDQPFVLVLGFISEIFNIYAYCLSLIWVCIYCLDVFLQLLHLDKKIAVYNGIAWTLPVLATIGSLASALSGFFPEHVCPQGTALLYHYLFFYLLIYATAIVSSSLVILIIWLSGHFVYFLSPGSFKAFGVIYVEWLFHYPDATDTLLSPLVAFGVGGGLCLAAIGTGLGMRTSYRAVCMIGGLLGCIQFVSCSFAPNVGWLYLTYGILGGCYLGMTYSPPVITIGQYFEKKRTLATGIVICGSGIGNFVLPNFYRYLFNEVGYRQGMTIIGGTMLHICICGALFRPIEFYTNPKEYCKPLFGRKKNVKKSVSDQPNGEPATLSEGRTQTSIQENVSHEQYHLLQVESATNQQDGDSNQLDTGIEIQCKQRENKSNKGSSRSCSIASFKRAMRSFWYVPGPQGERPLIDFSLLLNPLYMVYFVASSLASCSYNTIFLTLPAHAFESGMTKENSAFVVSITGIMDLVGRLLFGFLFDLKFMKKRYGFMFCIATAGVSNLAMALFPSFYPLCVTAGLFGLFGGAYLTLVPAILIEVLGLTLLPNAYGLILFGQGALTFLAVVMGRMRYLTGSWNAAIYLTSTSMMLGSLVVLLHPVAKRYVRRKEAAKRKAAQEISNAVI